MSTFAPTILKDTAKLTDPVERMKGTICYAIAGLQSMLVMAKPFNPLIGETFEGFFQDGTRYYAEHTSHHPPISNFLVEDPEKLYSLHGHFEFKAKVQANQLGLQYDGPCNVKFHDG